jgi:hypothetical protein
MSFLTVHDFDVDEAVRSAALLRIHLFAATVEQTRFLVLYKESSLLKVMMHV